MKSILKKIKKYAKKIYLKKVPEPYPIYDGKLLNGRVALITGGGSGIGYEIARSFLKNGATVIITGRNNDKLKNAKSKLEEEGYIDRIKYFKMDISETNKIEGTINNILKSISDKKIDILVNNAGISKGTPIGSTKIEDFQNVINTNITGTYFVSQVVTNYWISNKIKGNILNVSSSSALRPAITAYTMSKWALNGLTQGMAKKFIKYGITVNAVAPGPTKTPMLISDDEIDINRESSPIKRYIMPEEIANISVMLVSDMGKTIIGDTIYATGGAGTITYEDMEY